MLKKNAKKIITTLGIISFFVTPIFVLAISNSDVQTGDPTSITSTGAKISGSANPKGNGDLNAYGYFRYSTATVPPVFCNEIYGSNMKATNEINLGSGNSWVTFPASSSTAQNLTNLLPDTQYFYCAVASNKNNIGYGGVKSFMTSVSNVISNDDGTTINNGGVIVNNGHEINVNTGSLIPQNLLVSIATKPALVVNSTSAYLNGLYNARFPSSTWFEYIKKINMPTVINGRSNNPINLNTGTAASSNSNKSVWTKVGAQSHPSQTSGNLNFKLSNLSANTEYVFRAAIKNTANKNAETTYGNNLTFKTQASNNISPGKVINGSSIISTCFKLTDQNCNGTGINNEENGNTTGENTYTDNTNDNIDNNGNNIPSSTSPAIPHTLGQVIAPPVDAVVHTGQGIETVLARQIEANTDMAKNLGYGDGKDLHSFALSLADVLAKDFGYVNSKGKEIRVSQPEVAAYQLQIEDGKLTVYEYYNSIIMNIQRLSPTMRNNYDYEYYFKK